MDTQQQEYYNILLIGDSCDDIYHYGTCDRLSPEAPVPIIKQSSIEIRKGMSSNVRLNLESFKTNVRHITNTETIRKHRFIDSRFNQHLLRWDEGENQTIEPLNLNILDDLQNLDAIVISDYDKGFLPFQICQDLILLIKSKNPNLPIFVDTKKRNIDCYRDCYIKINKKEYDNLLSYDSSHELIVTLGDRGALYRGKLYLTESVEVFDVCGAGDVFLSSMVASYLKHGTIEKAIRFANKMATTSVKHTGTYVLTGRDIEEYNS